MLTKRERLEAAIAGEKPDRAPVALWRHFPVEDQDPHRLAEATQRFQDQFDFDFVKVSPSSSFCLKDWGAEDEWQGNPEGTRRYIQRPVQDLSAWGGLDVLDAQVGFLGAQLACLRTVRSLLGEDIPVIQTVFSPLAQAKNLAGGERLLSHLHQGPEAVEQALEVITETTIGFVRAALETGISGIFYAIQHASYRFFDEAAYARFGLPYDERIMDAAGDGWLNVLHLHGDSLMFGVAERLPAHVVNWHAITAGPPLDQAKETLRGKAICGGLRREASLVLGTPERVLEEAHQSLASVEGRGIVLGAGCVVPTIAPHANLAAARSAVEFA